jgi:Holliday junction resolvase RusA-like endonuclease
MAQPQHFCLEMAGQPFSTNQRRRAHWSAQQRDTATFRDGFALQAKAQYSGPPLERVRVDVTLIRRKGQSPLDPDNAMSRTKPVLDALVVARVVVDDSSAHVDIHVHQAQGPQRATRLEVTEMLTESEEVHSGD